MNPFLTAITRTTSCLVISTMIMRTIAMTTAPFSWLLPHRGNGQPAARSP